MVSKKYSLIILAQARKDIFDILEYISNDLHNLLAAENLYNKLLAALDNARLFPHSASETSFNLPFELRKIIIDNYIAFYRVIDDTQTIALYRFKYAKSDLSELF